MQAHGVDTLVVAGIKTSQKRRGRHGRQPPICLYLLVDASADPDADVHELLTTKLIPGHAEVITNGDLRQQLGGSDGYGRT